VPSLYVNPESLGKRINRRILKTAKMLGCNIEIMKYAQKNVNNKPVYLASVKITCEDKKIIYALRQLGIKMSKIEKKAYISSVIIADIENDYSPDYPIGVSVEGDYVIFLAKQDRILINNIDLSLYLSLISKDSIWLDYIGIDDIVLQNHEEITGIPIKSLSKGAMEDFSKILARKTVGEKYAGDLLEMLTQETEISSDEELPLLSKEGQIIGDLIRWQVIDLEGEKIYGHHYLDLVGVPKHVMWATLLAAILSDKEIIIFSTNFLDENIKGLINMRKNIIVLMPRVNRLDHDTSTFNVFIEKENNTSLLTRYLPLEKNYIPLKEKFIPITEIVKS